MAYPLLPACHFCSHSLPSEQVIKPCGMDHMFHLVCYNGWRASHENEICPICVPVVVVHPAPMSLEERVYKAAKDNNFALLQELLPADAVISADSRGKAIQEASGHGHVEMLNFLYQGHKEELSLERRSQSIYVASRENHTNIVQILLENASMKKEWRDVAIMHAEMRENAELSALLSDAVVD